MNWFVWRQHRRQLLVFGIILAIYAAFVIPTGLHFWHTYQAALADCRQNPANPTCSDLANNLFQSSADRILIGLIPTAILFLPIVFGVFWGAPLLAREYSEGTNSLAWTQGVSRRKWLTAKLAWMLAATVVFMAAFAGLNTWWSNTFNALNMNRFASGNEFGVQGVVPVAIGLFMVACGILFGAWFRKVMVAVGVTLAMFVIASHIVIPNFIRPYYMTPITVTASMGPQALNAKVPNSAWVISQLIYNGNGKVIDGDIFPAAPQKCQQVIQQQQVVEPGGGGGTRVVKVRAGSGDPIDACLNAAGWHQVVKYQPAYRYWDFQRIEAGIYLGLTALAVGATYWLVLKRDA